jgi:hypothetical protein
VNDVAEDFSYAWRRVQRQMVIGKRGFFRSMVSLQICVFGFLKEFEICDEEL